jgi:hypothetical protein
MAIKASLALALLIAVTIGLLLPTPGSNKPRQTQSAFETIQLRHG